jgi:hypothetical protein
MLKKFASMIEIDISPEQFVYRKAQQELPIATRGYVKKTTWGATSYYTYAPHQKTEKYIPITLFSRTFPDVQENFIHVLAAFISYGTRQLCGWIRPIIFFTGITRFETEFGFEYVVFKEAAKLIAFGGKEIYFKEGSIQK